MIEDKNLQRADALLAHGKFLKSKGLPAYVKIFPFTPLEKIESLKRKIKRIPADAPYYSERELGKFISKSNLTHIRRSREIPIVRFNYQINKLKKELNERLETLREQQKILRKVLPRKVKKLPKLRRKDKQDIARLIIAHELDEYELAKKLGKRKLLLFKHYPEFYSHIGAEVLLRESNRVASLRNPRVRAWLRALRMSTGEYSLLKSAGIEYGRDVVRPGSKEFKSLIKQLEKTWDEYVNIYNNLQRLGASQ